MRRGGADRPSAPRVRAQWARAPDKSQWHETWAEEFSTTGAVQRSADKWGCKAPGCTPEDGHANRWQERWGENWDGLGNVLKWTDKWAERDQAEGGGPPRSWGDKWEERNSEAGGSKNVRARELRGAGTDRDDGRDGRRIRGVGG